jgi:hypothetical protein
MEGYDYRRLANYHEDVVVIEWDLAVDPDDLFRFMGRARDIPDRVRVAPYRLYYQYPDEVWGGQRGPVWAHRRVETHRVRWVRDRDATCHYFGFGLIYLPAGLLEGFCGDDAGPLGDNSFSQWHYRTAADREVVIDWDVRPVHLNHPLPRSL